MRVLHHETAGDGITPKLSCGRVKINPPAEPAPSAASPDCSNARYVAATRCQLGGWDGRYWRPCTIANTSTVSDRTR